MLGQHLLVSRVLWVALYLELEGSEIEVKRIDERTEPSYAGNIWQQLTS